jgi:hypothetical protein
MMLFATPIYESRLIFTCLTLLLLIFGLEVHAEPRSIIESFERSKETGFSPTYGPYRKLEAELEKFERSGAPIEQYRKLGLEIAEIHISARNYQLALWALDRTGFQTEAEYIEKFLKETLASGPSRQSGSMRIKQGPHGIEFFEKNEGANGRHLRKQDGAINEAFSYELDRFIRLNRIPVTVQIGDHTRSVYIPNSNDSGISFSYEAYDPQKKGQNLLHSVAEINVFDYLIGATDRHERNSLLIDDYGNRLVLIDNADLVWSMTDKAKPIMSPGLPPDPEEMDKKVWKNAQALLDRIYSIDTNVFHERFDSMIGRDRVEILLRRIEELRKNDPRSFRKSCKGLFGKMGK